MQARTYPRKDVGKVSHVSQRCNRRITIGDSGRTGCSPVVASDTQRSHVHAGGGVVEEEEDDPPCFDPEALPSLDELIEP